MAAVNVGPMPIVPPQPMMLAPMASNTVMSQILLPHIQIPTTPNYCAYFSTHGRRYKVRTSNTHEMPQRLLRADRGMAIGDMITEMRSKYPQVCHGVFANSSEGHCSWELNWFFDEYDAHLHGIDFLYEVVSTMQKQNEAAVREFVDNWGIANRAQFDIIRWEQLTIDTAFNEFDMETMGLEFLHKALRHMHTKYALAKEQKFSCIQEDIKKQGAIHRHHRSTSTNNFEGSIDHYRPDLQRIPMLNRNNNGQYLPPFTAPLLSQPWTNTSNNQRQMFEPQMDSAILSVQIRDEVQQGQGGMEAWNALGHHEHQASEHSQRGGAATRGQDLGVTSQRRNSIIMGRSNWREVAPIPEEAYSKENQRPEKTGPHKGKKGRKTHDKNRRNSLYSSGDDIPSLYAPVHPHTAPLLVGFGFQAPPNHYSGYQGTRDGVPHQTSPHHNSGHQVPRGGIGYQASPHHSSAQHAPPRGIQDTSPRRATHPNTKTLYSPQDARFQVQKPVQQDHSPDLVRRRTPPVYAQHVLDVKKTREWASPPVLERHHEDSSAKLEINAPADPFVVEPVKSMNATSSIDATKSVSVSKPAESQEVAEASKSSEASEVSEAAKLVEVVQQVESSNLVKVIRPVESREVESEAKCFEIQTEAALITFATSSQDISEIQHGQQIPQSSSSSLDKPTQHVTGQFSTSTKLPPVIEDSAEEHDKSEHSSVVIMHEGNMADGTGTVKRNPSPIKNEVISSIISQQDFVSNLGWTSDSDEQHPTRARNMEGLPDDQPSPKKQKSKRNKKAKFAGKHIFDATDATENDDDHSSLIFPSSNQNYDPVPDFRATLDAPEMSIQHMAMRAIEAPLIEPICAKETNVAGQALVANQELTAVGIQFNLIMPVIIETPAVVAEAPIDARSNKIYEGSMNEHSLGLGIKIDTRRKEIPAPLSLDPAIFRKPSDLSPMSPLTPRMTPKSFQGQVELDAWIDQVSKIWASIQKLPILKQGEWTTQVTKTKDDLEALETKYEQAQNRLGAEPSKTVKKNSRLIVKKVLSEHKELVESLSFLEGRLQHEFETMKPPPLPLSASAASYPKPQGGIAHTMDLSALRAVANMAASSVSTDKWPLTSVSGKPSKRKFNRTPSKSRSRSLSPREDMISKTFHKGLGKVKEPSPEPTSSMGSIDSIVELQNPASNEKPNSRKSSIGSEGYATASATPISPSVLETPAWTPDLSRSVSYSTISTAVAASAPRMSYASVAAVPPKAKPIVVLPLSQKEREKRAAEKPAKKQPVSPTTEQGVEEEWKIGAEGDWSESGGFKKMGMSAETKTPKTA